MQRLPEGRPTSNRALADFPGPLWGILAAFPPEAAAADLAAILLLAIMAPEARWRWWPA